MTTDDGDHFVWSKGADVSRFAAFRVPTGQDPLCVEETAILELLVLGHEVGRANIVDEEAAITAMSWAAGLQRLRQANRDRLIRAWRSCGEMRD